jgi:OmpA-OmpF porin, OOP family
MKFGNLILAGAVALVLTGAASASDAHGWYIGLGVGWDQLGKMDYRLGRTVIIEGTRTSAQAPIFSGSAGYRFENHLRFETEFTYDRHTVHHPLSTDPHGHTTIEADFFNALYDIPLSDSWNFTLGAGAGYDWVDVNHYYPNDGLHQLKGNHSGFAWQGIAGLTWSLSRYTDIGVDYRYRHLSAYGWYDNSSAVAGECHCGRISHLNEQIVMLTARFFVFPAPPPAPPEVAPPPPPPVVAPPPPPPPPVTTYIVYFDYDKSNLTEKAQEVVAEAVKTAAANGFVKVKVVGHTDTMGSAKFNQALSLARAQAVKDEMIRLGLTGDGIAIDGKGFSEPLVSTGPGVREPQNRRAVIDLGK